MSKLKTDIDLFTINSEYITLSYSVRELLPLKIIIEEVIYNLVNDSEKLKFVSSSTVYEDSNGYLVEKISTIMTHTSKNISFKYHWLSQHFGKEFMI